MNIALSNNAQEYANSLRRYATETGKEFGDALQREAPDFAAELYQQFHAVRPNPASGIYEAAKGRDFSVSRKQSSNLVPISGGLSARAINRAEEIMGGQKSDYFRWVGNRLVQVKFSKRDKNRRILSSRRNSRLTTKGGIRAFQLPPGALEQQQQSQAWRDVYKPSLLNVRALAVYLELLFRQMGAQGGIMAVQWMFERRLRRRGQTAQLEQKGLDGKTLGTVNFEFDRDSNLTGLIFDGFVPGTAEQAQKRGILDKVFSARSPRLLNAIELHHAKVARQHGFQQ